VEWVQTSDGAYYALATVDGPDPDIAYIYRFTADGSGGYVAEQVSGVSATGFPTDPTAIREYMFGQRALGDAVVTVKGLYDPVAFAYTAFELYVTEGTTATLMNADVGTFYDMQNFLARAGDVIFHVDNSTAGGNEIALYDLVSGTTTVVDVNAGAESSDPRNLVSAGGGVYFRAVTEGAGFSGDLELVRMEQDGSFTVIELNDDDSGFESSAPRQMIALDADTVAVLGDSDAGTTLWLVTGTTVELTLDLGTYGIYGAPFVDGGSELFQGDLMFWGSTGSGDQLFRFDTDTDTVSQVTFGSYSGRGAFDYSMAASGGLLWYAFDEGYGEGLELYVYGDPYSYGYDYITQWTDLDNSYAGYDPSRLQVVGLAEVLPT
jgi:hypothetical protein